MEITHHKLNGLNEALTINVLDGPGPGGAHHSYAIDLAGCADGYAPSQHIRFQEGPIAEAGVNGVSGEALLAIVIHRLECFQKGAYSCRDNAVALTHLETALMWLQKRTRDRMARGVEGTSQK